MAKRKSNNKKRSFARRSRRAPNQSITRGLGQKIYTFQRRCPEVYLYFNNGGSFNFLDDTNTAPTMINSSGFINGVLPVSGFIPFTILSRLVDICQPNEFVNLFDSYRMLKTILTIERLQGDISIASDGSYNMLPEVLSCLDYDDANPQTTIDQINQYGNVKSMKLNANNKFKRSCQPKLAQLAYKTSGTGVAYTYASGINPWVDLSYPDVEHYGHKLIINHLPRAADASGNTQVMRIIVNHIFQMRFTR